MHYLLLTTLLFSCLAFAEEGDPKPDNDRVLLEIPPSGQVVSESGISFNAGHSGHWVDITHPGQGFIIEVLPKRGQVALAWFSFANGAPGEGIDFGQRWFTGLGPYHSDRASIVLFDTNGGVFAQPGNTITREIGDASIQMLSCTEATLEFIFDDGLSGVINLARLTDAGLCFTLSGQVSFPKFAYFRAVANAEFDDGMDVDCALDFIMEIEMESDDGYERHYSGSMGGEAARTVVDALGAGISFSADAFMPVDVRITGNRVNIQSTLPLLTRIPKDEDSRFWTQITLFEGDVESDGSVSGSWLCAPFDTRGDDSLFTAGRWWLEPIIEEPSMVQKH